MVEGLSCSKPGILYIKSNLHVVWVEVREMESWGLLKNEGRDRQKPDVEGSCIYKEVQLLSTE